MDEQTAERQQDSKQQILSAAAFQRSVIVLSIIDAALLLFLTFGLIFPRHTVIAETPQVEVDWYDYSAKLSPFAVPTEPSQAPKVQIPRLDVRNVDLTALNSAQPAEDGTVTVGTVRFTVANGFAAANSVPEPNGSDATDQNSGAVVTNVSAQQPQSVLGIVGHQPAVVIIPTVESVGPKRTT